MRAETLCNVGNSSPENKNSLTLSGTLLPHTGQMGSTIWNIAEQTLQLARLGTVSDQKARSQAPSEPGREWTGLGLAFQGVGRPFRGLDLME